MSLFSGFANDILQLVIIHNRVPIGNECPFASSEEQPKKKARVTPSKAKATPALATPVKAKAKATKTATVKKEDNTTKGKNAYNPKWSHIASRKTTEARSGLKGPGNSKTFGWAVHGGKAKAETAAQKWCNDWL